MQAIVTMLLLTLHNARPSGQRSMQMEETLFGVIRYRLVRYRVLRFGMWGGNSGDMTKPHFSPDFVGVRRWWAATSLTYLHRNLECMATAPAYEEAGSHSYSCSDHGYPRKP